MRTHHIFMTSQSLFLDITPSISDTTSTLSVSSRLVHQLYHTNSLYDMTHTLCKTSQSVCMTSHKHFMTSNPYRYDITHSIFMTWQQYIWYHHYCFHENTTIPDITPTIYDITATVSVLQHPLYQSITTVLEVIPLGTHMTTYTLYMTSQSHFMTSFLSIYDITATAFMTSYPLHRTSPPGFMTSCPLSLWNHRHYLCEYISTIFNIKHTVRRQSNHYIWNHNLHMCICVITHTVSMI